MSATRALSAALATHVARAGRAAMTVTAATIATGSVAGCGEATRGAADVGPHCPALVDLQVTGAFDDAALAEISGLVASRSQPGVFYVHNDSGDSARFFAVTESGTTLGEYALSGVTHVDWEDVALGPDGAGVADAIYIGDIGDNLAARASITVHRVAEPTVTTTQPRADETLTSVESLVFAYPDGAHDAETLLVDPTTGSLYVLSKVTGGPSTVYRANPPFAVGSTNALAAVGTVAFAEGNALPTGGDVSADGGKIVLRTYSHIRIWLRVPGTSLESSLLGPPCLVFEDYAFIAEAVAFDADGLDLHTVSEGGSAPLHRFEMR